MTTASNAIIITLYIAATAYIWDAIHPLLAVAGTLCLIAGFIYGIRKRRKGENKWEK